MTKRSQRAVVDPILGMIPPVAEPEPVHDDAVHEEPVPHVDEEPKVGN